MTYGDYPQGEARFRLNDLYTEQMRYRRKPYSQPSSAPPPPTELGSTRIGEAHTDWRTWLPKKGVGTDDLLGEAIKAFDWDRCFDLAYFDEFFALHPLTL